MEDDESDGPGRRRISEDYLRRSVSDIGDLEFGVVDEIEDDSSDRDLDESRDDYVLRRHSSAQSRSSVHDRLLRRDSTGTVGSFILHGRTNQKIYMVNEDLTIVVAGFRTSRLGYYLYILSCILTCGLAYLVFRWMPRWYVSVLGQPAPLRECDWVVIENQWGELVTLVVKSQPYGRSLSTVFGTTEKNYSDAFDEDTDPIIDDLRTLDYRYVRLCFHPSRTSLPFAMGGKTRAGMMFDLLATGWTVTRRVSARSSLVRTSSTLSKRRQGNCS